jgi:hypothetical protein
MTAQERALGSEKDRFAVNEAFFGGGLSLAQVERAISARARQSRRSHVVPFEHLVFCFSAERRLKATYVLGCVCIEAGNGSWGREGGDGVTIGANDLP